MANKPLSPPPHSLTVLTEGNYFSNVWKQWIVDLHRKISPNTSRQYLTAAGAVNPDANHCSLTTTTASYAITLEAPTIPGVWLNIELISYTAAKNVTLALTNVTGGSATTTCTWNGTNQHLILLSADSKWVVIKERGVALT